MLCRQCWNLAVSCGATAVQCSDVGIVLLCLHHQGCVHRMGESPSSNNMQQPDGFQQGDKKDVLHLLKSLYGLKQAGRNWYKLLDKVLQQMGFKKVLCDHSIWVFDKDGVRIIVPVYVDDLTIVSKSSPAIDNLIAELQKHFKLRSLGDIEFPLGVKGVRECSKRTIKLSQRQYILDMLSRYGFSDCSPVSTPMNPGTRLSSSQSPSTPQELEEMRNVPYAHAVGSLLYLAISTRPDIAYTVGVLGRFNANPGVAHWNAVKHLFRYLKGTLDWELVFTPDKDFSLQDPFQAFTDSDHGGDKDTGKSTGAYIIKMGSGAISWSSKLQSIVTLSTTEAEYISSVTTGQEILWLRNLFTELGYPPQKTSTLNIDNQSALNVAKNPEHHGRMKHLDLRYYWLRDVVEHGTITLKYCPTEDMPADLLTKPLDKTRNLELSEKLGLQPSGGS